MIEVCEINNMGLAIFHDDPDRNSTRSHKKSCYKLPFVIQGHTVCKTKRNLLHVSEQIKLSRSQLQFTIVKLSD